MNQSRQSPTQVHRSHRAVAKTVSGAVFSLLASSAHAIYSCNGLVGYLGVDKGGDVAVSLSNSTPIHKVCNVVAQGSYEMAVPSCKAVYGMLAAAKLAGKSAAIFYDDNGATCGTLPNWGQVPTVYFIQGPD